MQLELFFKIGYFCTIPKGGRVEQDCTQFAVLILCHDPTGCDEMDDYFAAVADTMIDIVWLTYIKVVFEYLYLTGIFNKLSHLNVNYYFLFVYLYIIAL